MASAPEAGDLYVGSPTFRRAPIANPAIRRSTDLWVWQSPRRDHEYAACRRDPRNRLAIGPLDSSYGGHNKAKYYALFSW